MSFEYDAYKPAQIARLVENNAIKKAKLPLLPLSTLGILAGAFIAFGAMFYTIVITDSAFGFGPTRLLGGVAFSLGLILVLIAGAELFTGNNLIVMAWAEKKVSLYELLRNWLVVYVANFVGVIITAWFIYLSGIVAIGDGAVAETSISIAKGKVSLDTTTAFIRGMLCNALVCLAIWLSVAAHNLSGKILAIIFPVSAFVTLGLEHSIANMYFISIVMFQGASDISIMDFIANLIPVTLGNIIGGSVFVALVYWICYVRGESSK